MEVHKSSSPVELPSIFGGICHQRGLEPIGLMEVGGGWVACSASFLALQAALASTMCLFFAVSPMVKQWCEI